MRRRTAFLLAFSAHSVGWILVLGQHTTLNANSDDAFFGLSISAGSAWLLHLTEAATIFITLLVMLHIGQRALATLLFSEPVLQPGICKRCGYDMRGSTIQCPECGYVVEKISTSR
jgi:hypothetical protein